ncbi:hypothetical protein Kpho02_00070 [Kitasatospora phosalacinea]|uniref:WXG100 family type VII secretion target n=1 Tax=Kitasatospora phosalacinea TaxID=2065 RepID=A0A9W6Q382_9ACTN|nr:hypothetical protein [Kitasatospora phosalacinea]GLW67708.1 hypothetical protein Kpho02_00070 [Kitasatospora phosalacinea]
MSQQIVVDEANLRGQGRNLESIGESFQQVVEELKARLAALEPEGDPPWGDDDLGEKFGVVYEGLRDGMKESMDSLAKRLGEVGQKVQRMADNHAANEADTVDRMRALGDRTRGAGDGIRAMSRPQL